MIHVCNLDLIDQTIKNTGAKYLVSLINKDMMPNTPATIKSDNHLKLAFNDITEPMNGYVNVQDSDIAKLINFLENWNLQAPILFHCWAGVSRSTAGAFIAANFAKGAGYEQEIAHKLREVAPFSTPNKLVVSLADNYLKRGGKMQDAIDAIGRGSYTHSGIPFMLPI
ncbi:MAG: tyrosine protein phosphatase [Rhizobiales bacterium]|nr:tyrosine protein phosphatase [Hyphomicrobiales bacterium]